MCIRDSECTGIARGPQRMYDGTHQPKDTAGALEALQRGPVLVEPVKQLRVNRVRRPDPTLIRRLAALARELTTVFGVELHESPPWLGDSCSSTPNTVVSSRASAARRRMRVGSGRRTRFTRSCF